ncbi:MAG: peptide-methionine (R)-S-oxide reductase MsrB [Planctomycetaceae bacterium]
MSLDHFPNDGPARSASGDDLTPLTPAEIEALAARLSPEERQIVLHQGTERAFCGNLLDNKREGKYACRLCGLPLFRSSDKFDSGTGWPSFFQPVDSDHVATLPDLSHGRVRVEIRCKRCDAHLGHVFEDGPPPTGLRYCLNSASMEFFDDGADPPDRAADVRGAV